MVRVRHSNKNVAQIPRFPQTKTEGQMDKGIADYLAFKGLLTQNDEIYIYKAFDHELCGTCS